mmetsp:Transcript_1226/g.2612  ORF Transcript_1226/g.2612 Transcript_1226/m.2612 type:complete len:539 (-) Transcript_1226:1602-3218(-)
MMSATLDDNDGLPSGNGNGGGGNSAAGADQLEPSSDKRISSSQQQHVADLERATQNSIRDSVGAFSMVPGERATRREGHEDNNENNNGSDLSPVPDSPSGFQVYNMQNLPANIDIIAEATLVEDDWNHSDVDTLGLHREDVPPPGGAYDDTVSVAVSAITNPAMAHDDAAAATVRTRRNDDSSETTGSQSPHHNPLQATVTTASMAMASSAHDDEERGETLDGTEQSHATRSTIVVHATPVKEGPLAFLQEKSGKIAASIAVILIVVLAIGLGVGLTANNRNNQDEVPSDTTPIVLPKDDVLTYTTDSFCIAGVPQVFYSNYPSYCTEDELKLGGTLQQAIAIAQDIQSNRQVRIPYHPFDVSILNAGSVRAELPADSPVTLEMINNVLPFPNNTISYLELTAGDLVKVIRNAVNYVTLVVPLQGIYTAAYPYSSGLRYDVDLSAEDEKVSSVMVFDKFLGEWISLGTNYTEQRTFWVVTNNYIAQGGDGYLKGVEPLSLEITDVGYKDALVNHLRNLDGDWSPPSLEEMSTTSFTGI